MWLHLHEVPSKEQVVLVVKILAASAGDGRDAGSIPELGILAASAGDGRDAGSIPELGRSPGGGHGNPLQHSCLENPMDRGAWWAAVHGFTESDTTEDSQESSPTEKFKSINSLVFSLLYGPTLTSVRDY